MEVLFVPVFFLVTVFFAYLWIAAVATPVSLHAHQSLIQGRAFRQYALRYRKHLGFAVAGYCILVPFIVPFFVEFDFFTGSLVNFLAAAALSSVIVGYFSGLFPIKPSRLAAMALAALPWAVIAAFIVQAIFF